MLQLNANAEALTWSHPPSPVASSYLRLLFAIIMERKRQCLIFVIRNFYFAPRCTHAPAENEIMIKKYAKVQVKL